MTSYRGFYGVLIAIIAVAGLVEILTAISAEHTETVDLLLGGLIAAIGISALYLGAVLDEKFPTLPKPQIVQPGAQQMPQGEPP